MLKYLPILGFLLLVGCGESSIATDDRQSEKELNTEDRTQKEISSPEIVSLKNAHSIKRYLEAEFDEEFEESTLGFKFETDSVEAEIHAFGGSLNSVILQFKPLSDESIDRAVLLTRKFLVAAGEDPREVEEKIDSGRAGYDQDSDGVEIKFAGGTYVRFSIWSGGRQDRAGVVIEPE